MSLALYLLRCASLLNAVRFQVSPLKCLRIFMIPVGCDQWQKTQFSASADASVNAKDAVSLGKYYPGPIDSKHARMRMQ